MSAPVRVLVVDDASYMRRSLVGILRHEPDIEVAGEAADGREGLARFRELRPDVVCLDVDMPLVNGVQMLRHVMVTRPTPVVVVSSLTDRDDVPFELLRLGVVDFVPKPSSLEGTLEDQVKRLLRLIRAAARVNVSALRRVPLRHQDALAAGAGAARQVVVIGGGYGSLNATLRVLAGLASGGEDLAVVCQAPIHPAIRDSLLSSVERFLGWRVSLAPDGDRLRTGCAYFAPDGSVACFDGDAVRFESCARPLDEVFKSTRLLTAEATLVLLAGDDTDGLAAIEDAARCGMRCYVQDAASSPFPSWSPEGGSASFHLAPLGSLAELVRSHARQEAA